MTKLALLSLALFGACKWTDFDDLETSTWAHSTTKPDSNSSDWGIAMVAGGTAADPNGGDRLVVLGTSQALFTELNYTSDGSADLAPTELKLNNQFSVATLDPQPILVKDPASDEVSLVVNSGGGSVAIFYGIHTVSNNRQIFSPKSPSPDAAAYVVTTVAGAPLSQLIVATDNTLYGSIAVNPPTPQPACALVEDDGTTSVSVKAIGGVRTQAGQTTDDIVVWSSTGKLLVYPSGVFLADATVCPAGTAKPITGSTAVSTGFSPAKGSQLHVVDNRYVVLAGHHDADTGTFVQMYDMQAGLGLAPATVGAALTREGQKSSTVLEVSATERWVVLGFPTESVNGTTTGQVALYPLDTTTGIGAQPDEQLSDAQPDSNELFGRSVGTFKFNGHQILAVGADNEVFAYYQTSLYGDTRAAK